MRSPAPVLPYLDICLMSYRAYYSAHGLCVKNSQPRGLMELDISAVADRAEMEHLYADSARPDDFPFLSV